MLAPIALFVYNRPNHTQSLLNSLASNEEAKESLLYVFCDGPKRGVPSDLVDEVKKVVKVENRFKNLFLIEQSENQGLANSIIFGVQYILERHDTVIVLEDDLIVSRFFLKFMNDSLVIYKQEEKVISIGACNYFTNDENILNTIFLPLVDCLGWATWKNRWKLFEHDSRKLLDEINARNLTDKLNLHGFYDFKGMLQNQISGKVDSWAIRWTVTSFLYDKVTLYPNPSLTQHVASTDATHASHLNIRPSLANHPIPVIYTKPHVKFKNYKKMLIAYYSYFDNNLFVKVLKRLKIEIFWIFKLDYLKETNKLEK